jgi:predicted DNA-binding protein|tara:strand:- start:394 stop:597 length:204 start_codon:yes stop_codon:yes gene_type:complete
MSTSNDLLNRPAKLKGDFTKYSVLLPNNLLEAMRILSQSQSVTVATLFRSVIEDYVMNHEVFKGDPE